MDTIPLAKKSQARDPITYMRRAAEYQRRADALTDGDAAVVLAAERGLLGGLLAPLPPPTMPHHDRHIEARIRLWLDAAVITRWADPDARAIFAAGLHITREHHVAVDGRLLLAAPGLPDAAREYTRGLIGAYPCDAQAGYHLGVLAEHHNLLPGEMPEPEPPREPYPVDVLPPVMQRYVSECASVMDCPSEYVALPLLAVAAGAIGASRVLRIRDTWHAPALLWMAVVGKSGTGKSPPQWHVLAPLRERQAAAYREHVTAMEIHREAMMAHERDVARFRRAKMSDLSDAPTEPTAPVCVRYVVDDSTLEALCLRLAENPRGLLLARDEIGGWLASMDEYRSGGDLQRWLSIHRGDAITIDRVTRGNIYVPRAHVSICGGIQPEILRRMMTEERTESGLIARILMAMPDARAKRWTDADVLASTREAWAETVDDLLALSMAEQPDGQREPVAITMSAGARARWVDWFDGNARRTFAADGPTAAALAKIEEYAARLGLVLALAADPGATEVDEQSMRAGIRLAGWHAGEAERIYAAFAASPADRAENDLVQMIREKFGGQVTPRELKRTSRQYQPTSVAEAALQSLADAGFGSFDYTIDTGGRPSKIFTLRVAAVATDANANVKTPRIAIDSKAFGNGNTGNAPTAHITPPTPPVAAAAKKTAQKPAYTPGLDDPPASLVEAEARDMVADQQRRDAGGEI